MLSTIVGDAALGVPKNHLTKMGEVVEKYIKSATNMENVSVDKYVIMPNHIHLILFINEQDGTPRAASPTKAVVPRFVAAFKRLTNKEIGKNIFQRSYHDHIIRNEQDYLRIWEYMENNPKQWELDCFYVGDFECI